MNPRNFPERRRRRQVRALERLGTEIPNDLLTDRRSVRTKKRREKRKRE